MSTQLTEIPIHFSLSSSTSKTLSKKQQLFREVCQQFLQIVDIDSLTPLSAHGHLQWHHLAKTYSTLYAQHPELFPDLFVVSPYLRTRMTIHYLLSHVQWLDLDIDKLLDDPEDYTFSGMLEWSFQGKDITLRVSERVRERDHGKISAPRFLRKVMDQYNAHNGIHTGDIQWRLAAVLDPKRYREEHYFKWENWGESQTQTNQRADRHLRSLATDPAMTTMTVTHHLFILGVIERLMWGGPYLFRNFNEHRRPANGWLTIINKIPLTRNGQTDRLRVAAYNLVPKSFVDIQKSP